MRRQISSRGLLICPLLGLLDLLPRSTANQGHTAPRNGRQDLVHDRITHTIHLEVTSSCDRPQLLTARNAAPRTNIYTSP